MIRHNHKLRTTGWIIHEMTPIALITNEQSNPMVAL